MTPQPRSSAPKIGIVDLFDGTPERDLAFIADFAQTAEELGFDSIWLPEHIVFFDEYESTYPYPDAPAVDDPNKVESHLDKDSKGRPRVEVQEDQGLLDISQTAAAVLSSTTTLKFGSSIMLLPLRNPAFLAREILTVAELTQGRFELGVGLGWSEEEFTACGVKFRGRGRHAEQILVELNRLDAELQAVSDPARPRMPRTLIGGYSKPNLRRSGQIAGGWYPWNLTLPKFAEHYATYREHLEQAGRSRDEQKVIYGFRFSGEPEELPPLVEAYLAEGADTINLSLRMGVDNYQAVLSGISTALGLTS